MIRRFSALLLVWGLAALAPGAQAPASRSTSATDEPAPPPGRGGLSQPGTDAFPSRYRPPSAPPVVIRGATVLTAAGPAIPDGSVLMRDGRIVSIGAAVEAPPDAVVVDGRGKYVTPGVIDTHSHLGVYAAPSVAEHSVWPQDPAFPAVLAGGVTTLQVLPGSGNLIGGRGVVLKVVPARTVQEMKFPGAKHGLKMACGENPKRVYQQRGPSTRMGNVAGYREQWVKAERYRREWDAWLADGKGKVPDRDLALETLADVLRGNILVQNHCYRADEMSLMVDIAKEFGYRIRSFHHAVEAYKVADLLAAEGIAASVWADWGAFKMESADAIRANAALVHAAGGRAVIHSDDVIDSQRLNQEAAKALAAGRAAGLTITEDDAVKWFTANPAWVLGLEDRVGTLEPGKAADVVLWSANPFSVYARAEKVWIDGALRYDRGDVAGRWRTDFELGFVPPVETSR